MTQIKTMVCTLSFVFFASCGGKDKAVPQTSSNEVPAPEKTEAAPSGESGEEPATPAPAPEPEIKTLPKGALNPSEVTVDTPVAAADLQSTFFRFYRKTILIHGYVAIPYARPEGKLEREVVLMGTVEECSPAVGKRTHPKVKCRLKEPYAELVKNGADVVLVGTVNSERSGSTRDGDKWVSDPSKGYMKLKDCRVVAVNPEDVQAVAKANPTELPYTSALELYDAIFPWIGKEVTVEGYYQGLTTSTLKDGKRYRADLAKETTGFLKPIIGCQIAEPPSEAVKANRPGTQVRGTIVDSMHPRVKLEGCSFTNR